MRFKSNLLKTYKSLLKTSFWVKNFLLPNYKAILIKNAFCFTSAQRIARCVENSVSIHFVLKTSFCQIIRISCSRMRFASNVLKTYKSLWELHFVLKSSFCQIIRISCSKMRFKSNLLKTYKSLLKTSFCVTNFLLSNYKAILPKNAF